MKYLKRNSHHDHRSSKGRIIQKPIISALLGVFLFCVPTLSALAAWYPADPTNSYMRYSSETPECTLSFNVQGRTDLASDKFVKTTYGNGIYGQGYDAYLYVETEAKGPLDPTADHVQGINNTTALNGVTISKPSMALSGGNKYVRVSYTLTNITNEVKIVSLAIVADTMIDQNDEATVSIAANGLSMTDGTYQFNLACRNTYGATNADAVWCGPYRDYLSHRWDNGNDYVSGDSALCFSWQNRPIPANGSITLSTLLGIGESAAPPEIDIDQDLILDFSLDQNDRKVTVTAKVKDAIGRMDTIYYVLDSQGEPLSMDPPSAADGTQQEIKRTITLPSSWQAGSVHQMEVWVQNDAGAMSETKTIWIKLLDNGSASEAAQYPVSFSGGALNAALATPPAGFNQYEGTDFTLPLFPASSLDSSVRLLTSFSAWSDGVNTYSPGDTCTMPLDGNGGAGMSFTALWNTGYTVLHTRQDKNGIYAAPDASQPTPDNPLVERERKDGILGELINGSGLAKDYGTHFTYAGIDGAPIELGLSQDANVLNMLYERKSYTLTAKADVDGGSGVFRSTLPDSADQTFTQLTTTNYYEHDTDLLSNKALEKAGYSFKNWLLEGKSTAHASLPSSIQEENQTYIAQWTANADTPYQVIHRTQDLDVNGNPIGTYTPHFTENKTGVTDQKAVLQAIAIPGFTAPASLPDGTVSADGSSVFYIDYTRNTDTAYNIVYYLQDLNADGTPAETYTEETRITAQGVTGASITAPKKDMIGFTAPSPLPTGIVSGEGTTVISVYYTRNTDTPYTVVYRTDDLPVQGQPQTYSDVRIQALRGVTGAQAVIPSFAIDGFTPPSSIRPETIAPDGSTVIHIQYERNLYTLSFDANGGNSGINPEPITALFEAPLDASSLTLTRPLYTFKGWEPAIPSTMPLGGLSCVAQWEEKPGTLRIHVQQKGGFSDTMYRLTIKVDGLPYVGAYKMGGAEYQMQNGQIFLGAGALIDIPHLAEGAAYEVFQESVKNYELSSRNTSGTIVRGVNLAELINTCLINGEISVRSLVNNAYGETLSRHPYQFFVRLFHDSEYIKAASRVKRVTSSDLAYFTLLDNGDYYLALTDENGTPITKTSQLIYISGMGKFTVSTQAPIHGATLVMQEIIPPVPATGDSSTDLPLWMIGLGGFMGIALLACHFIKRRRGAVQ